MSTSITFCGGARTVTGSMHLIESDGERVVIDCGLFQGHREEFYQVNSHFCFNPFQVDALVLSHSHIDHCGNLPNLVKSGFSGKIFVTKPTKELCQLMLLDSAKIQEEDIKFVNKINLRRGLPLRKPLYTLEDARKSLKSIRGLDYYKQFKLTPKISCAFYDAGHILGSATPLLEIKKDSGEALKIAYAVDLGRCDIPLLRDPDILKEVDYLIIESTYGGRLHSPIEDAKTKFAEVINRTASRGGKVIIPSFALERTQEVVYYLGRLLKEKKIRPIPIYVDSPLACNITDVFLNNSEVFDVQAQELLAKNADIFGIKSIHYIRTSEESKQLNFSKEPMIIISTSGMCESGRILHHLRNNIKDERNTIVVVGYMARNTLGKRIVERHKRVKIFGESFELKAGVEVINAFSAHADKNELVDYALKTQGRLKKIFIVHGDMDQSEALALELKTKGLRPYIPKKFETVVLE
ncbi:MAG: MBL fold metallo-hydrolase [Candidatus Omnitrophota bacterium]|nr:MBL fold metallo-hydrolase [Candidatus Omnitrophota bacterium]